MEKNIKPIPKQFGVGFCSHQRIEKFADVYSEENINGMYNYHFNDSCWTFPIENEISQDYVIDGFSPNLNKSLHIGHLRQLALSNFLSKLLSDKAKFVAMLGASVGVHQYALDELDQWFHFLNFHPSLYYDNELSKDPNIFHRYKNVDENSEFFNCEIYDGKNKPVVVVKSDGKTTYAFHDLVFAKTVGPTHYITGEEQISHFENLGLKDKHLPMGLVLGSDNKKMKSRNGDAMMAKELILQVVEEISKIKQMPKEDCYKLSWNIVCWNFLKSARNKNIQYDVKSWTNVDSPGMYISYTYARMNSALKKINEIPTKVKITKKNDIDLLWHSEYFKYHFQRSVDSLQSSHLATYALELSIVLTECYHKERIVEGRPEFQYSMFVATQTLKKCIEILGMFPLEVI